MITKKIGQYRAKCPYEKSRNEKLTEKPRPLTPNSFLHLLHEVGDSIIDVLLEILKILHGIYPADKSSLRVMDTLVTFCKRIKFPRTLQDAVPIC